MCDLKMPLWEFKILHIFEIPSSNRCEKHYQTLEIFFVVFHHSINIPWIEKLTIQNWNLQGFKIIYSTQLQVHWISVQILTSWYITKDLKQGLLKLKIAAANCFESTKTAQRYVKGRLISKCPFGVFKSSKNQRFFSRISDPASKRVHI